MTGQSAGSSARRRRRVHLLRAGEEYRQRLATAVVVGFDEPVGEGVEGGGVGAAHRPGEEGRYPGFQLGGCPAGEREHEEAGRRHPRTEEVGDAPGQELRFAGARPGEDQLGSATSATALASRRDGRGRGRRQGRTPRRCWYGCGRADTSTQPREWTRLRRGALVTVGNGERSEEMTSSDRNMLEWESPMYREAVGQFDQVARLMGLDENVADRLRFPQKATVVTFPFRRDTYEDVETLFGYRVQHLTTMGPTKGGIDPVRARREPRRGGGSGHAHDVEVRHRRRAVRGSQRWRTGRPDGALSGGTAAGDPSVHHGDHQRDRRTPTSLRPTWAPTSR